MRIGRISGIALTLAGAALCARAAEQVEAACLVYEDGYWQAATLDPGSGRTRVLTRTPVDKTRVSWFPDGKLLVSRNDGVLGIFDLSSGIESEVSLEQNPVLDAVVSPDGSRLAFSFSTAIDGNDIWVLEWPSRTISRVVQMPHLQHEPAWAADSKSLYFLSGDGGQAHDIWRFVPDTQAREQITVGELYNFDIAAGPDGVLAFSSNRDGNYELYLRDEGGATVRLTDDPGLDARPAFSPDGRSLLFESSRSGAMQIYRLDLASKKISKVTSVATGARHPAWRAGGRS